MTEENTLMPMGQLRWRCRRGMRELDVLLLKFLELRYDDMSQADKETFEAMLQLQDPDLNAMLLGKLEPQKHLPSVLRVPRSRSSFLQHSPRARFLTQQNLVDVNKVLRSFWVA